MSKNKKEKKKKLKYPNAPVTSEKYKRLENRLVFGGIILVNIVAVIIGILLNKYANLGDTLEIAVKYACSFIVILPLFVFYLLIFYYSNTLPHKSILCNKKIENRQNNDSPLLITHLKYNINTA